MLESTEPLAVVEIRDIFWDHCLQWTRCDIIDSRKNRAPFDSLSCQEGRERQAVAGQEDTEQYQNRAVEQVDDRRSPSQIPGYRTLHRNDSIQDCSFATQQTDQVSISDGSQDAERVRASLDADDSISGLHHRMDKMIVLESAQGSLYAGAQLVTEKYMLQEQSFLRQIQEDEEERWQPDLVKHLRSSQGSTDGEDEAEYDRHRETLQPAVQRNSMNDRDLTSELGEPTRDDTTIEPVDLDDTKERKVVSARTNTCISSISEIVSATTDDLTDRDPIDSDSSLEYVKSPVRAPSPEVNKHLPSEMTKDGKDDAHRQSINIIFSNLFSWTDLKIKDRVEIHEPCRKIVFSQGSGYVLIAERYRVLTLH